jgi:hypothetical protein
MNMHFAKALVVCSAVSALSTAALADIGPKPTMSIDVSFDHENLKIVKGSLLECQKSDCSDARPLERFGPQGFGCNDHKCGGRAYGFARYNMLEITLSDGRTLRSNIFGVSGMNSKLGAVVKGSSLAVTPAG